MYVASLLSQTFKIMRHLEVKQWLQVSPFGGILLEGIDDLASLAKLTDETLLPAQTTAIDMRTGKLDHLREEGSKLSIYDLQEREIHYKSGLQRWVIGLKYESLYFTLTIYHNIAIFAGNKVVMIAAF